MMLNIVLLSPLEFTDYVSISLNELVIIFCVSCALGLFTHFFFSKEYTRLNENGEVEKIKFKPFSLGVKVITIFITLIVIFMPIFKLLGVDYFI